MLKALLSDKIRLSTMFIFVQDSLCLSLTIYFVICLFHLK